MSSDSKTKNLMKRFGARKCEIMKTFMEKRGFSPTTFPPK